MAKEFKDFSFNNQKLSDLKTKYLSVNFDSDSDIGLAMNREMNLGDANRYRIEPNYFYDKWTDGLSFELNIIKDPHIYHTSTEQEITKSEIREFTRWLTSPHFPQWIKFDNKDNDANDTVRYFGWFNNIETWTVGRRICGLRLQFKCTTPFGYTDEITDEMAISKYGSLLINNDSDELENYCYPIVELIPNANEEIFICNLSDCTLRENGTLTLTQSTYFDSMLDIVENHALINGCSVEYVCTDDSSFNIVPLCNNTAVQFYLVDTYGSKTKCTAFYMEDTKEYRIINGGFLYMSVTKDLKVYMDCQKLTINDELGRMITYDKLGVKDVDQFYWPRLINGYNSILLKGKCKFIFKHSETRKVGE